MAIRSTKDARIRGVMETPPTPYANLINGDWRSPATGGALNASFGRIKNSSAYTIMELGDAAVAFYSCTRAIYIGHGT
jgi:hypothetical protein